MHRKRSKAKMLSTGIHHFVLEIVKDKNESDFEKVGNGPEFYFLMISNRKFESGVKRRVGLVNGNTRYFLTPYTHEQLLH